MRIKNANALPKIAVGLFIATLLFAQAPAGTAADEPAIRAVVQEYLQAREHRDAKQLAGLFTAGADQLVSSGEWRKGRDEVVRGTLQSSQRTGGNRSITIESIRFVEPDVALADGRYDLSGLAANKTRRMWTTLLLTRGLSGWRIAAIRNMLPAPPVPSKPGPENH
jgi:uncharacterized protein (TIGR02246 family)